MICRKWIALGTQAKGLALAVMVVMHAGASAQESKSTSGISAKSSLQPNYGFHQTSWQTWSAHDEPANPAPMSVQSNQTRPMTTRRSTQYNPASAPVFSKRIPEARPIIQPVTYLEVPPAPRSAVTRPQPSSTHKPVYGEQPLALTHQATGEQPLNWVASPSIPQSQPLPAKPPAGIPADSASEQTPVMIEWVPVRPSASPYKPQP
jgi:hypothetical protein